MLTVALAMAPPPRKVDAMDASRLDALARSLTEPRPRRTLSRLLGGLALAGPLSLLGLADSEAKKKKKKKKKKRCGNGETRCDDGCVNLQNDPKNCGDCGEECDVGQSCKLGECVDTCVPFCTGSEACCLAECVDLQTDAKNCGECGKACSATEFCRNGQCVPCAAPTALCTVGGQQTCVDARSDADNCGACGRQCPKDPVTPARNFVCQGGECVCTGVVCDNGRCCPAGFTVCLLGGAGCCPDGYTEDCGNGRCCPEGFQCGGTCGEECCP